MAAAEEPKNIFLRQRSYAFNSEGNPKFFIKPVINSQRIYDTYSQSLFVDEQVPSRLLRVGLSRLQDAPQGIYTWIMLKNRDSEVSNIYALRVRSSQEIGTLHMNILSYIHDMGQDLEFYASGEMMLYEPTKTIVFNMESSLFVTKVLKPLTRSSIGKRKSVANNAEKQKEIQRERAVVVHDRIQGLFHEYDVVFRMGKQIIGKHKFLTHPTMDQFFMNTITMNQAFDPKARHNNHALIDPATLFRAENLPNRTELPDYDPFAAYLQNNNNNTNTNVKKSKLAGTQKGGEKRRKIKTCRTNRTNRTKRKK